MALNKDNPHNDLPLLPPDKKYFETIYFLFIVL